MIANAVVHRSYLKESKIQVSIYDDRLEVISPGMLYGGLDIKMMLSGRSCCRNEAIAEAFQYMRIVEAWGTGVPRIVSKCVEYDLPTPLFEEFGDCIKVTMYKKQANNDKTGEQNGMRINEQANNRTSEQANKRTSRQENVQTSEQAGNTARRHISKQVDKHKETIRRILEEKRESTSTELAEVLGLSKARVRAILSDMEDVEAIGVTNTRKYRLAKSNSTIGKGESRHGEKKYLENL